MKATNCKLLVMGYILILSGFINLYGQTYQPTQVKFNYKKKSVYLDHDSDFQQKKITLGFHWNTGYKMNASLQADEYMYWGGGRYDYNGNKVNYPHPDSTPRMPHNANLIINSPYIGYTWSENSMWRDINGVHHNMPWSISHNIAMEYEPTYKVNLSNPTDSGRWKPRQHDTTGYAFGFGTVRGYISNNQNDPNYDRLQLYTDSLVGQTVLAEPWVSNNLNTIADVIWNSNDNKSQIIADTVVNIYNEPTPASWDTLSNTARLELLMKTLPNMRGEDWKGVNFYLSINLRRLDANDIAMNNDTILEIKMPWVSMSFDSAGDRVQGWIIFDSIPSPTYADTLKLARGVMRKLISRQLDANGFPIPITSIYITRDMLPRGDDPDRDITISAFFVCDGNIFAPKYHNYGLKEYWGRDPFPYSKLRETIDSLKIEVRYLGNCAVGIDKIKIETPASRMMSWGYFEEK